MLDSNQMNESTSDDNLESSDNDLPLAIKSGSDGLSLWTCIEKDVDLMCIVRKYYHKDTIFTKILAHPEAHQCFGIWDRLIWTKNQMGEDVVCVPCKVFLQERRLVEIIIDQVHTTIGHFGQFHTSWYIQRYYWWPSMGTDIELFCSSCASCQVMKDSNWKPAGLLHSLPSFRWD